KGYRRIPIETDIIKPGWDIPGYIDSITASIRQPGASDFIYLGDPSKESTLGRLIPEQISSRLAQHGFNPVSKRLANPDEAQTEVPGKARLVGSYTTAYDVLYVNARVIRLKDSAVIAGYDYELPASSNLRALIPGVWGDAGLDPTVKTAFSTAARR
ncbi:MAG: FlgO family outer membrane protein, partial [Desulfocurvibacter africanus]